MLAGMSVMRNPAIKLRPRACNAGGIQRNSRPNTARRVSAQKRANGGNIAPFQYPAPWVMVLRCDS
jgi:hypothetical protein